MHSKVPSGSFSVDKRGSGSILLVLRGEKEHKHNLQSVPLSKYTVWGEFNKLDFSHPFELGVKISLTLWFQVVPNENHFCMLSNWFGDEEWALLIFVAFKTS